MVELRHKVLGTVGAIEEESAKEPIVQTDLQSLIELGCVKEEVEINGIRFLLRSLNANERMALSKEFSQELNDEQLFAFNLKLLAFAIDSVNGQPLEDFHPGPTGNEIQIKMDIVASLQTPVITKLIDAFSKIMDRCDKQFGLEQVKN